MKAKKRAGPDQLYVCAGDYVFAKQMTPGHPSLLKQNEDMQSCDDEVRDYQQACGSVLCIKGLGLCLSSTNLLLEI